MILYHGSYVVVDKPDLKHSKSNVDFGKGFYVTPIYDQAARWYERFKLRDKEAVISHYSFEESNYQKLKVLNFDSYSNKWLDYILKCRRGVDDFKHDIVIGGIANDKVFNTIELFFDGLIDKEETIRRLRYEKPNLQIAFKTEKALSYLIYERKSYSFTKEICKDCGTFR